MVEIIYSSNTAREILGEAVRKHSQSKKIGDCNWKKKNYYRHRFLKWQFLLFLDINLKAQNIAEISVTASFPKT